MFPHTFERRFKRGDFRRARRAAREHVPERDEPGAGVEFVAADDVPGIPRDRVGFFPGDRLKQVRRQVLARLVRRHPVRRFGVLEEVGERREFPQHGRVAMHPPQVVEPGSFHFGPAGECDGGDLVVIHRLGHAVGEPQKTRGPVACQRNARPGVEHRSVGPFPAELAVLGIGVETVVEHDVQRALETVFFQDLRQLRRDAESPSSPDCRPALQVLLDKPVCFVELPEGGSQRHQGEREFRQVAANQVGDSLTACFA
jgi:hypothetical protein